MIIESGPAIFNPHAHVCPLSNAPLKIGAARATAHSEIVIIHLHSVPVVVSDYDRAPRFYRDAFGFEVTADVTDPRSTENRWPTLKPKAGQTSIMLLKASPACPEFSARPGGTTLLVFRTDDLTADCERIVAEGGQVLGTPKRAGWGDALEVRVADPDRNVFLLIQTNESRRDEEGQQ